MAIAKKELSAFIHLADNLHFARASQLSNLTPSALSRLVARLESGLGVTLFHRDKRSVELSPEGQVFYDYAKASLQSYKELNNVLAQGQKVLQGELSVYCSVTAAYSVLAEFLPRFIKQYASVDVRVHTGDPSMAVQRVLDGEEDISITAMPQRKHAHLSFKKIADSDVVLIAPKTGELRQRLKKQVDIEALPWIISEEGIVRERFDAWRKQQKQDLDIYAQVAGHEAIVSMVALGFGVGLVPSIVLKNSPQKNVVHIVKQQLPIKPFDICLCVKTRRLNSALVKALWDSV